MSRSAGDDGTGAGARAFACWCCACLTMVVEPPGSDEICPVCGWQDDIVQDLDPEFRGGANEDNLQQVRAAFREWQERGYPADPRRRRPTLREVRRPDT